MYDKIFSFAAIKSAYLRQDNIIQLHPNAIIFEDKNHQPSNNSLHLSISIETDYIVFSIYDYETEKIIKLSEKPFHFFSDLELSEYSFTNILQDISNNSTFKSVSLTLRNEYYTIVPFGIFNEENIKSFLELNYPKEFGNHIKADFIYSLNAYLVHYFPENLYNEVIKVFPTAKLMHHATVLNEMLIRENKFSESTSAYIYMNNDNFDLIVFDKSKLLLCNNYKFETKEDVLYYTLNSLEQLKLQLNKVELYLLGKSNIQPEIIELINNYYTKEISPMKANDIESVENLKDEIFSRYYINLTQHLCVL